MKGIKSIKSYKGNTYSLVRASSAMEKNGKWEMENGKCLQSGPGLPCINILASRGCKPREQVSSVQGFTLIEVLVSAAILVILATGFLGMQFIFTQNQVTAWRNYSNIEESNAVVSKFTKEIRVAKQSDEGSYPLVTLSDNEIVFYSDIDLDEDVERVRYTQSASELIKGVIEPSGSPISYLLDTETVTVVADNLVNGTEPIFYYYNEGWPDDTDNNPLPAEDRISDTKVVKIVLTINIKPDDPKSEYKLESSVNMRTLKEN